MITKRAFKTTIPSGERSRLDHAVVETLAREIPDSPYTRSQVKLLIEQGCVRLNARAATKAGAVVQGGDTLHIELPEPEAAGSIVPYDVRVPIVFEDESLLVIDKPAGLAVHPGAGNARKTLVNALAAYFSSTHLEFPDPARPGIVHRLDKDTSGLMVVARTLRAHQLLSAAIATREMKRRYLALVTVPPRSRSIFFHSDDGTIETKFGRHPKYRTKMSVLEGEGRTAITHWRIVRRWEWFALVECALETGRTHQIRVHLAHVGSPLFGDDVYGNSANVPRSFQPLWQELSRHWLHAYRLEFPHPSTGTLSSFASEPPPELKKITDLLGGDEG